MGPDRRITHTPPLPALQSWLKRETHSPLSDDVRKRLCFFFLVAERWMSQARLSE